MALHNHLVLTLIDPATTLLAGGWCRDRYFHAKAAHDFDLIVYKEPLEKALANIILKFTQLYPRARKINVTELSQNSVKCRRQVVKKLDIKYFGCQVDITALKFAHEPTTQDFYENLDEDDLRVALLADARRRDFTINSLYYDISNDLTLDPLGCGLEDLENRRLRLVDSVKTLKDDPVRILRAARFLCMYPLLRIHHADLKEYSNNLVLADLCEKSANDRYRSEFCRILKHDSDRGLHFLSKLDWAIISRALELLTATSAKDWARRTRLELFKSEHHLER